MNLKQMEYVISLAETGNFSTSAKELFISQPSLSQSIRSLENELGVILFKRTIGQQVLTDAGKLFVCSAHQMLNLQKDLLRQIDDVRNTLSGHVSVGMPVMYGTTLIPKILPTFYHLYPGIQISVEEKPIKELELLLSKGKIDIMLAHLPLAENIQVCTVLKDERILVATSAHHPLRSLISTLPQDFAQIPSVALARFQEDTFVYLDKGRRLRGLADELFAEAGFQPKIKLVSNNVHTLHYLTAAGVGVTILGEVGPRFSPISPSPLYFAIDSTKARWSLVVAMRRGGYFSKPAQAFIFAAKMVFREYYPETETDADELPPT